MRSIIRSIAAFAAAATVTGAGIVGATSAFAAGTPWANTVVIPNTLTLTLSTASATITPNLGGTAYTQGGANGQDFSAEPNTATVSSNDVSGYSLSETLTSPFTSGSHVVPDTAVQAWQAGQGVYSPFGGVDTDSFALGQPNAVSGNSGANPGNGGLYSTGGMDVWPIATGLFLPGNQPAGSYAASFAFQVVGS